MKPIFYYTDGLDLSELLVGTEVILEHKELSRFGKMDSKSLNHLIDKLIEKKLKVSLEWDVLMSETEFEEKCTFLNSLNLKKIDYIRVQDPGAIEFIKVNTTNDIVLILETGNHNLLGIQTWINYLEGRVKRVSLSVELDKKTLKEYSKELPVPIEFLGLGQILIFYTPRNLLSALLPEEDERKKKRILSDEFLIASGESEESPHKGFPLIENKHGTFMFHIKRLFLLDTFKELEEAGIDFLRLDTRFDKESYTKELKAIFENKDGSIFKSIYPYDVIKGYFNINKTDVLFKKLKNYRLQRKDNSYIGEVLETNKAEYMAILIKKNSVKLGDELRFITPEGKELTCSVHSLKNSVGIDIKEAVVDDLFLMNYFGSVWPKSQVYKNLT